jgi:predicted GNAT family N-acyltransferase
MTDAPSGSAPAPFREIGFGTEEYRVECRLRDEILRRPLGLSLTAEDLAGEESQLHFGLFDPGGELIACVVAVILSPTEARVRQMAVSPARQGMGLGLRMMSELEANLRVRGITKLVLKARAQAVGFYEKLGYAAVGDAFVDLTIPHFRMVKTISSR